MRVRIRKYWAFENEWIVESYHWYNFKWITQKHIAGDDAEKRALKCARELLNPMIIEITK